MTTVTIEKYKILDVLNAAEDNDWRHVIPYLVEWCGPTSKQEIIDFANTYLEEDGYGEDDVEYTIENLTEIFENYGENQNA